MPDISLEQDPQERPSLLPQERADPDPEPAPQPEPQDPDLIEPQIGADGKKLVPLSALIEARQTARELREKAQHYERVAPMLQNAQPFLEQLGRLTPEQQSAAIQSVMTGTAPSRSAPTMEQAADRDAEYFANELGIMTNEGALDVARARRILDRVSQTADARAEAKVAPFRQSAAAQSAAVMYQNALALSDKTTGEPMASEESLTEAFRLVPPEMAADPRVGMILALTAIGMDRYHGRTPKRGGRAPQPQAQAQPQYGDPIMSEAPGRRPSGPTADERAMMKRTGATERDFKHTQQLGTGRSINLEG